MQGFRNGTAGAFGRIGNACLPSLLLGPGASADEKVRQVLFGGSGPHWPPPLPLPVISEAVGRGSVHVSRRERSGRDVR